MQLAEIVARHPIFAIADPALQPRTWEEKVVHYADRLVDEERIVSVSERVEGLCRRHPKRAQAMRSYLPASLELEAEICAHLEVTPEELLATLEAA